MSKKQKKLDPRVVRTRRMLRDALVALIADKGFDAITVQDITDRATVNRATFYLHYQDKNDLLIKSLREALDDLVADIGPPTTDEGQLIVDGALRPILMVFKHVAQHADFYRVMLGADGVPSFVARVRDYISEITLKWLSFMQPDPDQATVPLEIVASYLSWAYLGVIVWGLENDMPETPERMADQVRRLMTLGMQQVLGLEAAPV